MQEVLKEIHDLGANLVAISPQLTALNAAMVDKQALEFDILSDSKGEFTGSLNINFDLPADLQEVYSGFGIDLPASSGESRWALPMPARIVVGADGVVHATDIDPDYTVRPEASKTIADLKALNG